MTARIIITMVFFTALFVGWFYFIVKLKPETKPKARPKWLRILYLTGGIFLGVIPWLLDTKDLLFHLIYLALFGIRFIYLGLEGWLFNRKQVIETASADSETAGPMGP